MVWNSQVNKRRRLVEHPSLSDEMVKWYEAQEVRSQARTFIIMFIIKQMKSRRKKYLMRFAFLLPCQVLHLVICSVGKIDLSHLPIDFYDGLSI